MSLTRHPTVTVKTDPGSVFRHILRWSGLVFVGMLFLAAFLEGTPILTEITLQSARAWGATSALTPDAHWQEWLFKAYNCSFITVYLCPLLLAVLASPALFAGERSVVFLLVSILSWVAGVVPPLTYALFHLISLRSGYATHLAWMFVGFHIACGCLLFVMAMRHRRDNQYVFWMGSYLFVSALAGLGCLFCRSLLLVVVYAPFGSRLKMLTSGAGLVQMVALILGLSYFGVWLAWWQAIRKATGSVTGPSPRQRHAVG